MVTAKSLTGGLHVGQAISIYSLDLKSLAKLRIMEQLARCQFEDIGSLRLCDSEGVSHMCVTNLASKLGNFIKE